MPGDSVKVAVRVRPFNQVMRFFFSVFFFSFPYIFIKKIESAEKLS